MDKNTQMQVLDNLISMISEDKARYEKESGRMEQSGDLVKSAYYDGMVIYCDTLIDRFKNEKSVIEQDLFSVRTFDGIE